ncbi:extracellular solute-binding protein (plasmid) [Ketogulonicigenium vulgare Y25]|uniref:Dipeptide ABC transporter (Dipeptide-binding protein) n=2 Tax=Ketogulonicigenium vulgare TaxID=92945 RepID=F9YAV0_KETVW|nr:extracellular solute-binding protein [Ketogulonicigenium vulgare Y25]AEM42502.1 Dipeptide ABC transporter (Dipeptide-binding protein) [Ketogulonicigenium vulgare WSH-001]ALJ82663.1 peptide ABC transporter [Ketogulonicigenium vulgare]AOZ53207.1 extracellular solute-binding protein [Ketogulonicigenium vulgare]
MAEGAMQVPTASSDVQKQRTSGKYIMKSNRCAFRRYLLSASFASLVGLPAMAQHIVMAVDPGSAESNLYWETIGGLITPNMQSLVGNDPVTGVYDNSGLAESWEHNEDFTSWTFTLKENAAFSGDWGPVTAADVVHSVGLHIGESSRLSGIQALRDARVTALGERQVRFDLANPDPDFLFMHAGRAVLVIYSKAQFDAEGLEGYAANPAGSGPFTFVSRDLANTLRLDAVEDYWGGVDVSYDTLELRFVGEPATRLAMVLAGEADIVSLPRELQPEAVAAGNEIIASAQASMQSALVLSGLFLDPAGPASDLNLPWQDIRVREAMNRALDREALIEILYDGRAEPLVAFSMDPRFDGYAADLADKFEANYGYDPDRARALLAEAGYPEAFANPVIPIIATALGGSPEFGLMAELAQALFAEVGLQAEIREMDWPTLQNARLGFTADFVHPMRNAPVRPNAIGVLASYTSQLSPAYSVGSAELNAMGDRLIANHVPAERAEIVSEMFTYIFDNYTHLPIATVSAEVVVNPERVLGWSFPGASSSGYSHFHLIETAAD